MLKTAAGRILQPILARLKPLNVKSAFCGGKQVKKNGTRQGKQRYRCQSCNRRFDAGERLNAEHLWQRYTREKQTAQQLAQRFGCSRRTISRHLQKAQKKSALAQAKTANLLLDATFFGKKRGVTVVYDAHSKQALYLKAITVEKSGDYRQAIDELRKKGTQIQSITCDGLRGLFTLFPDIPVQMCRFH